MCYRIYSINTGSGETLAFYRGGDIYRIGFDDIPVVFFDVYRISEFHIHYGSSAYFCCGVGDSRNDPYIK
jgi:hypothetical protein